MPSIERHYIKQYIREFIFGGRAEFTILNTINDIKYQYHVKANEAGNIWFVSVKIDGGYRYAGFIKKNNENEYEYIKGKKGMLSADSVPIKGLLWVIRHADNMHPAIKVIHHGRCAKCGKELTDEESIERGFGPICYKRVVRD